VSISTEHSDRTLMDEPPTTAAPDVQPVAERPALIHGNRLFTKVKALRDLVKEIRQLPTIPINLRMSDTRANAPFFREITLEFFRDATRRLPIFPLVGQMEYGVAVCDLRADEKAYSLRLDSAARRNLKKAARLGYSFERIDYNAHLEDVTRIHRSASVRQGRDMPAELLLQDAAAHNNPESTSPLHDYPYFGVFKENRLVAYASCLIAGELCGIDTIYGHADFLSDGVVPLLFASIGEYLPAHHPSVRFYCYGTYYGGSETMKRFKRKFLFIPHRVQWVLGD
jgi:hypothetical protein